MRGARVFTVLFWLGAALCLAGILQVVVQIATMETEGSKPGAVFMLVAGSLQAACGLSISVIAVRERAKL